MAISLFASTPNHITDEDVCISFISDCQNTKRGQRQTNNWKLSSFCIVVFEMLITVSVIVHDLNNKHFMLNVSSVGRFYVLSPHVINDNVLSVRTSLPRIPQDSLER